MQEQSQKQFKEMMEVLNATFEKNSPSPTNPKNPKSGVDKKKRSARIVGWRCITSPRHVSNLKPTLPSALGDGKARRAPEGVRRSSPQSSGDRARLISLN